MEDLKAMEGYVEATKKQDLSPDGFRRFFAGYALSKGWEGAICPV